MSIGRRLERLERSRPPVDGPCPWPYRSCVVVGDAPVPDHAAACPLCGRPHVLRIRHVVVEPADTRDRA